MHIGLIGGIGPAATDYYYRGLIRALADQGRVLDATIVHADAPTLIGNVMRGDRAAEVAIYAALTKRLQAAGAKAVAVTSIAGHFCIEEFTKISPLPVINIIDEVSTFMNTNGHKKVGLIGTKTVMQSRFYNGLAPTEIITPSGTNLDDVHQNYVDMATAGTVTEEQRQVFFSAGRALMEQGVDAVMLGGTDLFLAFNDHDCGFDLVDCAQVHIDALARVAGDEQDV